jgi:WD40 repeat protein
MTNLTKYDEGVPNLPWVNSDSLAIPWALWDSKAIAFSMDGKLLALGGIDSTVRVWSILAGTNTIYKDEPLFKLESGVNDSITAIAFRPDGQWLAAGSTNGTIYIWNLLEGRLVYTLFNQSGLIKDLAFSEDSTMLVTTTLADAFIWQIGDRQMTELNSFNYGITSVYSVAISPRADILATARGDGTVWLQSLPDGQVIGRLGGSRVVVSDLTFSFDGTLLATRSFDRLIGLWQLDMDDSNPLKITPINTFQSTNYTGSLSFSPDNKYLASTGMVGEVVLWKLPEGKKYTISSSVPNAMVSNLAFSLAGDKLATVIENTLVLWAIPTSHAAQFFETVMMDTFIDSQPFNKTSFNDLPQLQTPTNDSNNVPVNIDQLANQPQLAPFFIPAHLPESFSLGEAGINQDGSIWLKFDSSDQPGIQSSLFIYEKIIGDLHPPSMPIGISGEIIHTTVDTLSGGEPAEYVRGDWIQTQSFTQPIADSPSGDAHTVWQWVNSSYSQRLRWNQYGLLIAIYYQVNSAYLPVLNEPNTINELNKEYSLLTQEDLEQIASGMMRLSDVKAMNTCFVVTDLNGLTNITFSHPITNTNLCLPIEQEQKYYLKNRFIVNN